MNANMRIKQLIPLDESVCALMKYTNEDGLPDTFDAISEGWGVYRALYCDREDYDEDVSTYDVSYYEVPPDCFDGGFIGSDEILIVPNYKCKYCGNRMIPSVAFPDQQEGNIHYRCPVCGTEMDFDKNQPTCRTDGGCK